VGFFYVESDYLNFTPAVFSKIMRWT